jgi:hypothetical protein
LIQDGAGALLASVILIVWLAAVLALITWAGMGIAKPASVPAVPFGTTTETTPPD